MAQIALGWLVLGLPLVVAGLYFLWRSYRPVFWMYLGALVVGFGYLTATGAMTSIGGPVHKLLVGSGAPVTSPAR